MTLSPYPPLQHGPIGPRAVHLCVDMQKMFDRHGPWATPWMSRVLPTVHRIARRFAAQTIFTRFIPPQRPEDMPGLWRHYYAHWRQVTREQLDPRFLDLLEPLAALAPPAHVLDKRFYSPFHQTGLAGLLAARGADTVVMTGAETDMCVLAAVLDSVDLGLRTIVVGDAVCSACDQTHDALLRLYARRFRLQVELTDTATVLQAWR